MLPFPWKSLHWVIESRSQFPGSEELSGRSCDVENIQGMGCSGCSVPKKKIKSLRQKDMCFQENGESKG